ncbi:Gfo/Idh/MocA family protein [Yinghuangia sp. YIM S09857]|uniref:Gfo/Idh/MocA family protein n=1 Tax=Yinghuangia sp. YIM S09857 TaxID=3436929 RepID=UPI003F53C761
MTGPAPAASARPLRVLLAGFSGLGSQDHQTDMYLPAFTAHPGFELAAVAGDEPQARATAERLGVPLVADLATALGDVDADVVSVCVRPDERAEVAVRALENGRHVLVDKPAATDTRGTAAIAAAASSAGRVCLPAHHQRFAPGVRAARAAVAGGRVGLPWNIQSDFLVGGGDPVPEGELANFAVYPVDIVLALTGQAVHRVHALAAGSPGPSGAERTVVLMLDHAHGVTSTIVVGRGADGIAAPGTVFHRHRVSGSSGVLVVDAAGPTLTVRGSAGARALPFDRGSVNALVREFHGAVTEGRPADPDIEDALAVARIVDAARTSLRTGLPVDVAVRPEPARTPAPVPAA